MSYPRILWKSALEISGATVTAGSTDAGSQYDVANVLDRRAYTLWKGADASDNYIQALSLSPVQPANCVAIIGHNLGTVGASVDVDQWNGSTWIDLAGPWTPTDDKLIFKTWAVGPTRSGYRINFTSLSGAPIVGVAMVGYYLEFPRYLASGWDPTAETVVAEGVESKAGNLLGATVRYHELNLNPNWSFLDPAWIDANFRDAWDQCLSLLKPFVWSWDYSGHESETYFVRMVDNPSLSMPYDPYRRSLVLTMRGPREL